ncbi:MAG: PP2C family protein-serine/threonine phosphatase [Nitrososphaerales archaeon]
MKQRIEFEACSVSNSVGPRHVENQDTYLAEEPLFAVADGVGGYDGAKDASRLAIQALRAKSSRICNEESMKGCLEEIHFEVQNAAHTRAILNMGTTIAAAKVFPGESGGMIVTGNVGDSPILFFEHRGGVKKRFVDDSHRDKDSANIYGITQYLGLDCEVDMHAESFAYSPGDMLLICSDGITDNLKWRKLEDMVRSHKGAKRLVDESIASGTKPDDLTAILLLL